MRRNNVCFTIELCLRWVLRSFSSDESLSVLRVKSKDEFSRRNGDKFEKGAGTWSRVHWIRVLFTTSGLVDFWERERAFPKDNLPRSCVYSRIFNVIDYSDLRCILNKSDEFTIDLWIYKLMRNTWNNWKFIFKPPRKLFYTNLNSRKSMKPFEIVTTPCNKGPFSLSLQQLVSVSAVKRDNEILAGQRGRNWLI